MPNPILAPYTGANRTIWPRDAPNLTTGEILFRKAYLGSIVVRIEVDDREVRILGRKDVLEQCVLASGSPTGQVRRSVRGWLARTPFAGAVGIMVPAAVHLTFWPR